MLGFCHCLLLHVLCGFILGGTAAAAREPQQSEHGNDGFRGAVGAGFSKLCGDLERAAAGHVVCVPLL